ncbi:MAG: V-type ATP synthase subunit F [Deltaproteobacteria bacterium]|nr:V-type ATP synthase subunit F [Deltaproteobacteria bacterium]
MAGILVLTGKGASLGFRCAGLECREAGEDESIPEILSGIQASGRYGLVVVEERFLEKVPENVMKRIRKKGLPIIIPVNIPGKWGEAEYGESPVVRLIRRAIGYQIKLRK